MTLGSCYECIPILELCLQAGIMEQQMVGTLRREPGIVARMLRRLIQKTRTKGEVLSDSVLQSLLGLLKNAFAHRRGPSGYLMEGTHPLS